MTKSGRPVVPASLRKFIVTKIHNESHFGVDKTYGLLKSRFFWPNMYKSVQLIVSTCTICQKTKCDTQPPKAPLLPMIIPNTPMQFISMDIAYIPVDTHGYQYILVIGDIFSKFIQAIPLCDQKTKSVIEAFSKHWLYIHGNPYYLLSDQRSNMDGEIIREFCNTFGIEKRRSSAYHSQGSGFAERHIRNIKDILRAVLLQRGVKQWRTLLTELVFSLSCSESKAIKCIPYAVVFGRSPVLPIDILLGASELSWEADVVQPKDYSGDLKFSLHDVFQHVIQHLQLSKQRMLRQYNRNIR